MLRGFKSSALPLKLIPVLHWIYSPIFSLYPRELQLAMNIIIKKKKLENPGIDPGASRIQIERSTTLTNPRFALNLFTNIFVISSWVAISNEYIYKETNITLVYWFYWPIFSLFPRALQFKNEYNYKETEIGESGYRSRCLSNANRALYHLS